MKTFDAHTSPSSSPAGRCVVRRFRRPLSRLFILAIAAIAFTKPATAQKGTFTVSAAPGGIALAAGGGGTLSGQFGTMNALGLGTPGAGVTVIPLTNGALYLTHYHINISGLPNPHLGAVTAFVNSNFTHPAALIMQSCPAVQPATHREIFLPCHCLPRPQPRWWQRRASTIRLSPWVWRFLFQITTALRLLRALMRRASP